MEEQNYKNNIDKLLSKVRDGEIKYQKSALFNTCVRSLAMGGEPINIISELIEIIDNQQTQLEKYVMLYGGNRIIEK